MKTLVTEAEWANMRNRTEAIARKYASGSRKHKDGTPYHAAPVASWIRSGVARCGRPYTDPEGHQQDHDNAGRLRVWDADGSLVQEAVQMAMLTTYRQAMGDGQWADKPAASLEELTRKASSRACFHLRRWDMSPGSFMPNKMARQDDGGQYIVPLSFDDAVAEVEAIPAKPDPAQVERDFLLDLAALLGKLPDTCRVHAVALVDWIHANPGRTAYSTDCPVHPQQVSRLVDEVAAAMGF